MDKYKNPLEMVINSETDSLTNYIIYSITENVHRVHEDDKVSVNVLGHIENENGDIINTGELSIGTVKINPESNNEYSYTYSTSEAKMALDNVGNTVNMAIAGNSNGPIYSPVDEDVYVPLLLNPNLSNVRISNDASKTITWTADPNSVTGKVGIQIFYLPHYSQLHNSTFPNSINSLVYNVQDNGSFTIPAGDLNSFPDGVYVVISITRMNRMVSNSFPFFNYLVSIVASTMPIIME